MQFHFYRPAFVCLFLLIIAATFTASFGQCGTSPVSGAVSVSTPGAIVNSYYPGTGSPATGTSSLTVGAIDARGSATAIAAGDLVMIVQVQGTDINNTNTNSYGNGVAGAPGSGYLVTNLFAGLYEYNTVSTFVGSTITFSYSLANNYYTQTFTAGTAIRSYQIIRVPRYYDLTIAASSSITAPAWNGATGGIVVLEAANTLNFAAATSSVTVAGKGFRGGGGKQLTGSATITNTDYRFNSAATTAANATGGSKGEGIAGTPIYIPNIAATTTTTGTLEGYINGSIGWGSPANAGGGGTDGGPSANQYNTGGGGGSNAGAGGNGGSGWDGTGGNALTYATGGAGATSFVEGSLSKVIMGGGGGAGCANNSTIAQEYYCSGASGGGIIFMRAKSYSGSGSVIADGAAATDITIAGQTDAAGGGGAGGSIILVTTQAGVTGLAGVIVSAKGGKGANMTTYWSHGPGGGGGGGIVYSNNVTFTTAPVVTGGANGTTHLCCTMATAISDSYGSTAGAAGTVVTLGFIPALKNTGNPLSPCGVLPIIIKDFKAVAGNETSVLLSWAVEQEVNFKQFVVEYSTDGIHFSSIGTISFDAGKMSYQFTHLSAGPVNYYRLKLVDNDDNFSYSHVLSVRLNNTPAGKIAVYPNPSVNNITIRIQAAATQTGNIQLTDNNGRLITRKQASLVRGQNFISFPEMDQLPAGIYHLRIGMDGIFYTEKLVRE